MGKLKKVIEHVLVIPISSASTERSFLMMQSNKTDSWTFMYTTHLLNLAFKSIKRVFKFTVNLESNKDY